MQQMTPTTMTKRNASVPFLENQIDFRAVLDALFAEKWLILGITLIFLMLGIVSTFLKVPQYQSDILLQIEDKRSGKGLNNMLAAMSATNGSGVGSSDVQIVLIKSRHILAPAIDALGLDISITPHYFPIIGSLYARFHQTTLTPPLWGLKKYAWSHEDLQIDQLFVAPEEEGVPFTLMAEEHGAYQILTAEGQLIAHGKVGQLLEIKKGADIRLSILIKSLTANPGTEFFIAKESKNNIANQLAAKLQVLDLGQASQLDKTGVLQISTTGSNPHTIAKLLNAIAFSALHKENQQKSAEAAKTLAFLNQQIPLAKAALNAAEVALNKFRTQSNNIDVLIGSPIILKQLIDIQKDLVRTNLQRSMMLQKYTLEHPYIIALDNKKAVLEKELQMLQGKLKKLPVTDQVVINLMRDVKVKNTLYLLLLNKVQELQVISAGTMGDVHILSLAVIPNKPLPSGNLSTIVGSMLLGFILGCFLVFIRKLFHRAIQDPNWLEQQFDIPTFAIIPHSNSQVDMVRSYQENPAKKLQLLATLQPQDVSIEALRSLRTSLQFALIGSNSNIVSIMGISPGVGKSFISANFAWVLAHAGKRILMIDGDLRKGYLHQYFTQVASPGLSEAISGGLLLSEVIQKTEFANIDFLAAGIFPPNPAELLMSEQFKNILFSVSQQYDLVLIDTPPILAVADCAIIGYQAGVNFLVVGAGKHQAEEIELAIKRLQNNNVKLHGSIFNHVNQRQSQAATKRYNYYYDYHAPTKKSKKFPKNIMG